MPFALVLAPAVEPREELDIGRQFHLLGEQPEVVRQVARTPRLVPELLQQLRTRAASPGSDRLSIPELVKKISLSVVTITTPVGRGSGVIVDAAGFS